MREMGVTRRSFKIPAMFRGLPVVSEFYPDDVPDSREWEIHVIGSSFEVPAK
jgi:hypothetical protein